MEDSNPFKGIETHEALERLTGRLRELGVQICEEADAPGRVLERRITFNAASNANAIQVTSLHHPQNLFRLFMAAGHSSSVESGCEKVSVIIPASDLSPVGV